MNDDLYRRLAGIERQNRTLRYCVLALGFAVIGSWGWQSVQPAQSQANKQVVMTDDGIALLRPDGTRASLWAVQGDGDAEMIFYDRGGKARIMSIGAGGGIPSLAMNSAKGELLVLLNVDDKGNGGFILGGENNKIAASISVLDGDVALTMSNKEEDAFVHAGFREGKPVVQIQRKDGTAVWGSPDPAPK